MRPAVLGDALAEVFSARGDDVDVIDLREVDLRDAPTRLDHYDVAVITEDPGGLHADLVVELPDAEGGRGPSRVISTAGSQVIDLRGLDDLMRATDT